MALTRPSATSARSPHDAASETAVTPVTRAAPRRRAAILAGCPRADSRTGGSFNRKCRARPDVETPSRRRPGESALSAVTTRTERRQKWSGRSGGPSLTPLDQVHVIIAPEVEVLLGQQHDVGRIKGLHERPFVAHRHDRAFPLMHHEAQRFNAGG